jgi:hypothetical protein
VVGRYAYYLRRVFTEVGYVLAGRLAAVVQGAPVRVHRLDLAVTESALDAVRAALSRVNCTRWSERWQEFCDYDADPGRPGPMRWLLGGYDELRLQVVDRLPVPLDLRADGLELAVWPLAELETVDDDVADVMRRVRERAGTG